MKSHRWSHLSLCLALLVSWVAISSPARAEEEASARPTRDAATIAIGDVHGDYQTFVRLLVDLKIVDDTGRWIGGTTRMVQTGDLLDRGAESRRVLDLLMRLEKEAREAGGRVTVLLGNHEVMNLTGNLSYAAPGELAAFARDESDRLRREKRDQLLRLFRNDHPRLRSDFFKRLGDPIREANFDAYFPPGYFAHRAAFSPDGTYGRWLLARDVVHVDGRTLFVHAGISPAWTDQTPLRINRRVRDDLGAYCKSVKKLEQLGVFDTAFGAIELQAWMESERRVGGPHPELAPIFTRLDAIFRGPLFAEDGPLWYRGLALDDERTIAPALDRLLRIQSVDRIVIGHTMPATLTLEARCENRILLIDTGMNRTVYGGRPSALIIDTNGKLSTFE